jgi:glycosyltransferase involved in cell wall biosynthesis
MELGIQITAALRALGLSPKLIVMGPLGPHNAANVDYLRELNSLGASLGVSEDVIFLQEHGAVSDAARRDLYLLADLLLFPSLREGFGIPILEAGLARLPVFCSDIPPFHESAGPWANYIGLDETPAAIAARLAARLEEDTAHRLRRRVLEEYNWASLLTKKIVPLLEETWI